MAIIRKLGRRPALPEKVARLLKLNKYLKALPPVPSRIDWSRGFNFDWGMMLNADLGCCTEAKKGHAIQIWTLDNGRLITPPDSVVLAAYETDGGYVPGDPSTDNGEDIVSNLTDWRRDGFGGHVLDAFAAIDYTSFAAVQQAIYLFGLVDIGFSVPQSAMDQNAAGQVWDVVPDDGGIVGGHDVVIPMFDAASGLMTCITWGMRQMMTWNFFAKYVDEAYCLLSPDWLARRGLDPSGFDIVALQADLAAITA